ncbi:MAG: FkbM family methyltransferase [Parvularculaceae bacterium]|nr:FkbM family methyltransferase [Parvularculaceae bacterium]
MRLPYPDAEIGAVMIGDIVLRFRNSDAGGTHYQGRGHRDEYKSPFYPALRRALSPEHCIDIGANYGFTGLLMRKAFPDCRLTLVEPVPALENFIRVNFERNGARFDKLLSAIVSSEHGRSSFGVNTKSSQDSRVVAKPGWEIIETDVVTLDQLAQNARPDEGVYIKIDTQGWEEHVFAGGGKFLAGHDKWLIKTEFAPMWLESQGSKPESFLRYLMGRYSVHESLPRYRWGASTLHDIIGEPLRPGREEDFVNYVRKLMKNDRGWLDLFILPQPERRKYDVHARQPRRHDDR